MKKRIPKYKFLLLLTDQAREIIRRLPKGTATAYINAAILAYQLMLEREG